jgi:hypothetical protein
MCYNYYVTSNTVYRGGKAKLGEIASVQIGLLLSRKQAETPFPYIYKRLLPKSLKPDGTIDVNETEPYKSSMPLGESALSREGTILMKLSYPLNPVLVTKETENLVVPSQMAVIIPHHNAVMLEYIRIYLSQKAVAERLLSNYALIAQKGVTIQTLANLDVEIPSIENQRHICGFYTICNRLHMLRADLELQEQKRMQYIFSMLCKDKRLNYGKE